MILMKKKKRINQKRNERRNLALGTLKNKNINKYKTQNEKIPKLISQKQKIIDELNRKQKTGARQQLKNKCK